MHAARAQRAAAPKVPPPSASAASAPPAALCMLPQADRDRGAIPRARIAVDTIFIWKPRFAHSGLRGSSSTLVSGYKRQRECRLGCEQLRIAWPTSSYPRCGSEASGRRWSGAHHVVRNASASHDVASESRATSPSCAREEGEVRFFRRNSREHADGIQTRYDVVQRVVKRVVCVVGGVVVARV